MAQNNDEYEVKLKRKTTQIIEPNKAQDSSNMPYDESIESLSAQGFNPDLESLQSSPKPSNIERKPFGLQNMDSEVNLDNGKTSDLGKSIDLESGYDTKNPWYNGYGTNNVYHDNRQGPSNQGSEQKSNYIPQDIGQQSRGQSQDSQDIQENPSINQQEQGPKDADIKKGQDQLGDNEPKKAGEKIAPAEQPLVSPDERMLQDGHQLSEQHNKQNGPQEQNMQNSPHTMPEQNPYMQNQETNSEPLKKDQQKQEPYQETGNGYGALNKLQDKVGANPINDSTARARRNLEHTRQMQQGDNEGTRKANNTKDKKKISTTGGKSGEKKSAENNPLRNVGNKLKNGLKQKLSGQGDTKDSITERDKGGKKSIASFVDNLRRFGMFLASHPHLAIIFGVVILFFLILIICCIDDGTSSGGKRGKGAHCTYNLQGVTSMGEVKLEGLQVELINCDGKASNYTVLETVDFEKYVLGVALAEIGSDSPDEAIKSQIIAARGFALTRNSGMCPGNQDGCFYGYNVSTGKIRMRACEADQVYWDYEKDIYRHDRGSISLYSPEVNSGSLWKAKLSDERKAQVLELANDVKGKVLVDRNNRVVSTNYVNTISQQFISKANEGKTYDKILAEVYTESDGFNSGNCTSVGNIDYGDYVLSSDGHEILHQPLDSFLQSKGSSIEELNSIIAGNVEKAGYGTKAGVVAAAVTLIAELGNNYSVKVPYYWGGGHYDGVVDGVLGYWGSTQCHTYANGQSYNYCGFDCSGFVPWAIKNGGYNMAQMLAGKFQYLDGAQRVTLTNSAVIEPGDLLESSGHIVLVVGIEESSGSYICAEASGNSSGVLFTRRPFNSRGYWGVKMDGWYGTHVRSK